MTRYGQWEEQRDCFELLIVLAFHHFWSWLACTKDFREAICQFLGKGELHSSASRGAV